MEDLIGRTLGGRYKIISLLGRGGMGAVYEAEQTDLHRRVAVKVLARAGAEDESRSSGQNDNDRLRFKQEALAVAGLTHPNIVQVIDYVDDQGEPLLVMELLRGRSLASLVKSSGKLDAARAVGIMTQVLSALSAAHDARIVHRDVKPENIFVCESPLPYELVKVLDFGLARPLDDELRLARTRVGIAIGTPAYMSPEQARGASADVRMDVFAAGVTLYYALSGRRPWSGKTTTELLRAVRGKQPPIPLDVVCPELDLQLVRVVERSLSKDLDVRFASAREFLEALTPHWPKQRTSAVGDPPIEPPVPTTRSTRSSDDPKTTKGRKRPQLEVHPFRVISPAMAPAMASIARFARDGNSALAIGPAGLARWTIEGGWSGRELPSGVDARISPERGVRGFAFGPNGEALVFGDANSTYIRVQGAFTRVQVPANFVIAAAHVDSATDTAFAGSVADEAAVIACAQGALSSHLIARGYAMHAITRVGNALVACGARGTLVVIEDREAKRSDRVHAHIAGKSMLRAIASTGDGFVAVGGRALVVAAHATGEGLASATEIEFADDDLSIVHAAGNLVCAAGLKIHVALVHGGGAIEVAAGGLVRDVWLGPSVLRVLLDTAAVLEADVSGAL